MLTLRQMDSIVHNTLLIFEGFEINRREEGTNIFYEIQDSPESGKRFLGTYRVWEWHDGSGRSEWRPLETSDSEITRIRHIVWEAIMAIAVPANQSTENDVAQSTSVEEDEAGQNKESAEMDLPEIGFEIAASFVVPLPWDVLVSASDSCLKGYAPGFVEFEIVKQLPASIIYRLWQSELGELGTVEIRKLGTSNSEIDISGVPTNSVDTAPMWLRGKSERDQKLNNAWKEKRKNIDTEAYSEVTNEIDKAKASIRAKQKNHQANVIKAYFDRLLHDLTLWTSNKVLPPSYLIAFTELAEWPDSRMLSQETREYFERYKLEICKSATPKIGAVKDAKRHHKSGRPHLSEDVWAWEQVNTYNRQKSEVYKEWLKKDDVKARNLQDPERQFDRITKPDWGNKSGQNI